MSGNSYGLGESTNMTLSRPQQYRRKVKSSSEITSLNEVVDLPLFFVVEPDSIDFVEFLESKVKSVDQEFDFIRKCKFGFTACASDYPACDSVLESR